MKPAPMWRKSPGWWDELHYDTDENPFDGEVFSWLDTIAPEPGEHDYVLYTDGSGCTKGWGGSAAIMERQDLFGKGRRTVERACVFSGTYGSTVQRREFTAFLDGLHAIVTRQVELLREAAEGDERRKYEIGRAGPLALLNGEDRVTILWFTDRQNLAKALLYDQHGEPLAARVTDRDLWLRWSFFARYVCITPMALPRNQIAGQAACDSVAGMARAAMLAAQDGFKNALALFVEPSQWEKTQPQTALI